jgi:endo-1,4-beta-mannosidase
MFEETTLGCVVTGTRGDTHHAINSEKYLIITTTHTTTTTTTNQQTNDVKEMYFKENANSNQSVEK